MAHKGKITSTSIDSSDFAKGGLYFSGPEIFIIQPDGNHIQMGSNARVSLQGTPFLHTTDTIDWVYDKKINTYVHVTEFYERRYRSKMDSVYEHLNPPYKLPIIYEAMRHLYEKNALPTTTEELEPILKRECLKVALNA